MNAQRHQLEKYNPDKRDVNDNRKKISWAVFSYITEQGEEYRRSFTAPKNTPETEFWNIAPKTIIIK